MFSRICLMLLMTPSVFGQITPDCRCHTFQSKHSISGKFKSPDYRNPISPTFECVIYTFIAKVDEIVHITFIEFQISKEPDGTKSCMDYVRIFSRLQHAVLNEADPFDFELCGNLTELPQLQFYSSGRYLLMHLRFQPRSDDQLYGFLGEYRFEKQVTFLTTAATLNGTNCDQLVVSSKVGISAYSLGFAIVASVSGRIQSPDYPQNYPADMVCHYYFIGDNTERVLLNLLDLQLPKTDSQCKPTTEGDSLKIEDATLIWENLSLDRFTMPTYSPLRPTLQLWHSCEGMTQQQFISDGPYLIVTFVSDNDSRQNRGFAANYRFVNRNQVKPTRNLTSTPNRILPTFSDFHRKSMWPRIGEPETYVHHINWFAGVREGHIQSIGFPSVYPKNTRQLFVIMGPIEGEIQLTIAKFKLDSRQGSNCAMHPGDKLELFIGEVALSNRWRSLCGTSLPVNLRSMKLRVPKLSILFKSDNRTTTVENGFYLNYRIVSNPDEYSTRSTQKELLSDERKKEEYTLPVRMESNNSLNNCTFVINSKEKTSGTVVISPPFRSAGETRLYASSSTVESELCRWIFLGTSKQRIRIQLRRWSTSLSNSIRLEEHGLYKSTLYAANIRQQQSVKENRDPSVRTIGCSSPYYLEIQTFQNISSPLSQFPERGDNPVSWQFRKSSYRNDITVNAGLKNSTLAVGDRVKICLHGHSAEDRQDRAFMSPKLARIDVILKAVYAERMRGKLSKLPAIEKDHSYSVEYHFVTDFGVLAPFGKQEGFSCKFVFESKTSKVGNFSSPNYPGHYPVDTVCEYMLLGGRNEVVNLHFIEFDIESSSSTCSTDEKGDYIELNPCSVLDFLNMPQMRLCQARPKHKDVPIRWNNPCLLLRFVSNEVITRRGFLAAYSFEHSTSAQTKVDGLMMITTLALLSAIHLEVMWIR